MLPVKLSNFSVLVMWIFPLYGFLVKSLALKNRRKPAGNS